MKSRSLRLGALTVAAASSLVGLVAAGGQPAMAGTYQPVNRIPTGLIGGLLPSAGGPTGSNDWSCKPTAQHPYPVVLVHGTYENMYNNWGAAAPLLAENGYCAFALNYGGRSPNSPVQATGPIADSAAQLATFVDRVRAATGASKVDIVGHSQGGMMPRYYLKNLGGGAKVDKLVGLAPSNHGTTINGLTELGRQLGTQELTDTLLGIDCQSCVEQEIGSDFLAELNAGGETVPGIEYTVIATKMDEVVTPYTSAFLAPAPNVTNITVQDQCALDTAEHLSLSADPVALTDVLNALDPDHPRRAPCPVVLPASAGR
jgi:triacylglycerol esterase/lipase EstA (alpha/beta hydrolase family)